MSIVLFQHDNRNRINATLLSLATSIIIFLFWDTTATGDSYINNVILILTLSSLLGSFLIILEPQEYFYLFLENRALGKTRENPKGTNVLVYDVKRLVKSPFLHQYFVKFTSSFFFLLTLAVLTFASLVKEINIEGFTTNETIAYQKLVISGIFIIGIFIIVVLSYDLIHEEFKENAKLVSYFYALKADKNIEKELSSTLEQLQGYLIRKEWESLKISLNNLKTELKENFEEYLISSKDSLSVLVKITNSHKNSNLEKFLLQKSIFVSSLEKLEKLKRRGLIIFNLISNNDYERIHNYYLLFFYLKETEYDLYNTEFFIEFSKFTEKDLQFLIDNCVNSKLFNS